MANTRIGLLFAGPKTSVLMTNFTTLDPWFSLRRSSISTDTSGAKIPLFRIILLTFLLPANCGNFRGITVRFFVTVYHQVHHNPEALVQITKITVIDVATVQPHHNDKKRSKAANPARTRHLLA